MEFLYYLLRVSGCLIVFYLLYFLLFRNETFSKLNRIYLISTVLFSLFIPIIPSFFAFQEANEWVNNTDLQGIIFIIDDLELNSAIIDESPKTYSWLTLPIALLFAYGIGVLFFAAKFILNISKIVWQIRQNKVVKKQDYYLVKSNQIAICSFGKYVFWNENLNFTLAEQHQILQHELIHVKEKHTIDILFLEFVSIVLWFNPFIYLYKTAVRNVHEYIADSFVFNELNYKSNYAQLLIKEAVLNNNSPAMAHTFFNSVTKNRLIMLSKVTHPFRRLKLLAALPILCFLCLAFSIQSSVETKQEIAEIITETIDNTIIEPIDDFKKEIPKVVSPAQDTSRPKMSIRDVTIYREDEDTKVIEIEKRQFEVPVTNEKPKSNTKTKGKEISEDNPMKNVKPGQYVYAYDIGDKFSTKDDGSLRTENEMKDQVIKNFKEKRNQEIKREDIILVTKAQMQEVIGLPIPRKKSIKGELETASHWSVDWSGIQNGKLNDMNKAVNQRFKMKSIAKEQTKITSYSILVSLVDDNDDENATNHVKYDIDVATDGNMFPEDILEAIKQLKTTGFVQIFEIRFESEGRKYVTRDGFKYKIN